jgi:hypothetical protein
MNVPEADRAFLWDMLQAARLIQQTVSHIPRQQFLEDYLAKNHCAPQHHQPPVPASGLRDPVEHRQR